MTPGIGAEHTKITPFCPLRAASAGLEIPAQWLVDGFRGETGREGDDPLELVLFVEVAGLGRPACRAIETAIAFGRLSTPIRSSSRRCGRPRCVRRSRKTETRREV